MIVPALSRKEDVEEAFLRHLYTDEMFYYTGYANSASAGLPEIDRGDGLYQWAIVDEDDDLDLVVGYISYRIDGDTRAADRFGLFSFDRGNPAIAAALLEVIERLRGCCHRIEWRMIEGNPVQKHYDKICEKFGGTRLTLHDFTVDRFGRYHDEYIYEILPEGRTDR